MISLCYVFIPFYQLLYKRPIAVCGRIPKLETNRIPSKWTWMTYMHFLHETSVKLYWTKDELYYVHFYSSVMPHDPISVLWNICIFVGNQNPSILGRKDSDYFGKQRNQTNTDVTDTTWDHIHTDSDSKGVGCKIFIDNHFNLSESFHWSVLEEN